MTETTTMPANPASKSWFGRLLDRLSRVTSSGRYVPLIDGLRCVAIMAVMLFHINESLVVSRPDLESPARETILFHILKAGHVGVPLFFAISGFILTLPFLESYQRQQSFPLGRYFLRRLTRLEPPYILNLVLVTGLLIVVNQESLSTLIGPLLASVTYVHNLVYGTMSRINCVAWSLEIEVQFYLMAPIIAWSILRQQRWLRRTILVGIILSAAFAKVALDEGDLQVSPFVQQRLMLSLFYHLDSFLVGMLLADIYYTDWNSLPQLAAHWDLIASMAWVGVVCSQWSVTTRHILPLVMFVAYFATFRARWLSRALSQQFITVIGGMCYTLYLYHFFVISLVNKFTLYQISQLSYYPALAIQIAVIVPLSVVVAAFLFGLIELPCMIWRPFNTSSSPAEAGTVPRTMAT